MTLIEEVIDVRTTAFSRVNSISANGDLTSSGSGKVISFATMPVGLAVGNFLYISGGLGTAEAVAITAVGATTVTITTSNTHTGSWAIQSASGGIQEAIAVVSALGAAGGIVYIPAGTYTIYATIRLYSGITLQGAGIFTTKLQRTGDFGNTFVSGTSSGGAINIHLFDLWCIQIINYVPGTPPIVNNKPTSGAHWFMNGPNSCSVHRCRFDNLPYGIDILGGADVTIQDCQFQSLFTFASVLGQIGLASIRTRYDATLGIPTYIKIRGSQFYGYADINPARFAGPQTMILINGCEDFEVVGGSMGGAESSNIQVTPVSGQTIVANLRVSGVKFDGAGFADMRVISDGTLSAVNTTVENCIFNGEIVGIYGLKVEDNGSGVPAVIGLNVTGNIFYAYLGTAVQLNDGDGLVIADNVIYFYNNAQFGTAVDGSGIFIGGRANNYAVTGNLIGGGQNYEAYGSGGNHCRFAIQVNAPTGANSQGYIIPNYVPFPTAILTQTDPIFNTLISQRQYISTETGANNAIAGALPNVPLLTGLRVTVKLAHSLQAGANTFNLNGGGAVAIKSSRNTANNIGTAYASGGTVDLQYDGTEWVDLSQ